jgi:hypothetical protein
MCIGPIPALLPIPSWHLPQVFPIFTAFTVDLGSFDRKILWIPWHEAQFAARTDPSRFANP